MNALIYFIRCSILLVLALSLQNCSSESNYANRGMMTGEVNNGSPQEGSAPVYAASTGHQPQPADFTGDYIVFERYRAIDNQGFTEPAFAYSLLLPKGWQTQSQIEWVLNTQKPMGNNTYTSLNSVSPDGNYELNILPAYSLFWENDPTFRQINGLTINTRFGTQAPPVQADEYVKKYLVNNFMPGGRIVNISPADDVRREMEKTNQATYSTAARDLPGARISITPTAVRADVDLPGNSAAIIFCGVNTYYTEMVNQYNGSILSNYISTSYPVVIFRYPKGERAEAEKMLTTIWSSRRMNDYWVQQTNAFWKKIRDQKQIAHLEKIRIMDEQTRAIAQATIARGNQRLNQLDNQMKSWEQSQSASDRTHTKFLNTMRGVDNYVDETGTYEISSGYNHIWSRNDGSSFIMTNSSSFDPSSQFQDQAWKEMKLVQ